MKSIGVTLQRHYLTRNCKKEHCVTSSSLTFLEESISTECVIEIVLLLLSNIVVMVIKKLFANILRISSDLDRLM